MTPGRTYDLKLLSSISGVISVAGGHLRSVSDSTDPLTSKVITAHNDSKSTLPATLKTIDIYSDLFYHFDIPGTEGVSVILPYSYIIPDSVTETNTKTKTFRVQLPNIEVDVRLVEFLVNNGYQYTEL